MPPKQNQARCWYLVAMEVLLMLLREVRAGPKDVAPEFNVMCKIYSLAVNGEAIPAADWNKVVADEILEIKRLNMSTSDETFFNSIDEKPGNTDAEASERKALKEFVGKSREGDRGSDYVRPPPSDSRERANRRIGLLLLQAENYKRQLEAIPEPSVEDIRDKLLGVVFGLGHKAVSKANGGSGTFQSGLAAGCGGSGGNAGVGKSLASDMVCLCTHKNSAARFGSECYGSDGAASKHYDSETNAGDAWAEVEA
ncbi:unnamed protein product, partial [Trypanosoma congolense IL3000]